jgi:hypothetical protein
MLDAPRLAKLLNFIASLLRMSWRIAIARFLRKHIAAHKQHYTVFRPAMHGLIARCRRMAAIGPRTAAKKRATARFLTT